MLIRVERESMPDLYTSCKHPQTEVRKMPIADGGFQLKKQCLACGELTMPGHIHGAPAGRCTLCGTTLS